jgi:hypothetical protein
MVTEGGGGGAGGSPLSKLGFVGGSGDDELH